MTLKYLLLALTILTSNFLTVGNNIDDGNDGTTKRHYKITRFKSKFVLNQLIKNSKYDKTFYPTMKLVRKCMNSLENSHIARFLKPPLSDFGYQIGGFTFSNKKYLFLNCYRLGFHELHKFVFFWRRIGSVHDGGCSYWRTIYDIEKDTFSDIRCNGIA